MTPRPPLSQPEVESLLLDLGDRLETETEDYADACDDAATAEVAYKAANARAIVLLSSQKMTAQEREARALLRCEAEHKTHRLALARQVRTKELLVTIRTRMDALRTISANVRGQT